MLPSRCGGSRRGVGGRPNLDIPAAVGAQFHDGEKVLAKDVVASLNRWTARDQMGLLIRAIQQDLTAVDDRTVKWVLKKPFPKMLLALGKISTPVAFMMPERIAQSDPFKQITEYVGSGPMRFMRNEWAGAKAAFEKFADYVPRQEPGSWLAGGKRILVDRIEWNVMPDASTAAAALQNGEIDRWESPISDLVRTVFTRHVTTRRSPDAGERLSACRKRELRYRRASLVHRWWAAVPLL
jgi:peptide/nickel transport system substrate-binding protein